MNEFWVNVYYHSDDNKCYQGYGRHKTKSEAILIHNLTRNAFKPRPILAYQIHVKMKPVERVMTMQDYYDKILHPMIEKYKNNS